VRNWKGIERNTVATDDAGYYIQNVRVAVIGELQRRPGMSRLASVGAKTMNNYWTPNAYFNICFTSTGTIETVQL
jgi:hypothetical protein